MTASTPRADPASVGRIGIGCATLIRDGVAPGAGRAIIERALQAGVNVLDTAAFYGAGRSEELVGEAIQGVRDRVHLITKGGVRFADVATLSGEVRDCSYDGLRRDIEGSLTRLRTAHVDVYLLHQQDLALAPETQMEALARVRDEGLAREVGFSNFGAEAFRRAVATGIPTYVEYSYSLLDNRYVAELYHAAGMNITRITYGTFAHGLLSEKLSADTRFSQRDWRARSRATGDAITSGNAYFAGEAYLGYLEAAQALRGLAREFGVSLATFVLALTLRRGPSDIALVGCRSVAELDESLAALALPLDEGVLRRVDAALASVQPLTGNRLGGE